MKKIILEILLCSAFAFANTPKEVVDEAIIAIKNADTNKILDIIEIPNSSKLTPVQKQFLTSTYKNLLLEAKKEIDKRGGINNIKVNKIITKSKNKAVAKVSGEFEGKTHNIDVNLTKNKDGIWKIKIL